MRITVSQNALPAELSDLSPFRLGNSLLLLCRNEFKKDAVGRPLLSEDEKNSFNYNEPSCCLEVTNSGIQRCAFGDSQHGQSQTRFVHSLLNITHRTFEREVSSDGNTWKVLLVSKRGESPLVTKACDALEVFQIWHQVEEKVVNVHLLKSAINRFRISIQDLLTVFSLSSCNECPSTRKFPQRVYIKAFIQARIMSHDFVLVNDEIFRNSPILCPAHAAPETAWHSLE